MCVIILRRKKGSKIDQYKKDHLTVAKNKSKERGPFQLQRTYHQKRTYRPGIGAARSERLLAPAISHNSLSSSTLLMAASKFGVAFSKTQLFLLWDPNPNSGLGVVLIDQVSWAWPITQG